MYLKYVHIYDSAVVRITENLQVHENILLSEKSPCDIYLPITSELQWQE